MAMNSFVDVRLPEEVEKGAQGGPQFSTTIVPLDSGFERRNAQWAQSRGAWNVGYGIQYKEDLEEVIAFFYARMGKLVGFRFKDWTDYEADGVIATGTATPQTVVQAVKRYESGGYYFDRQLKKLVAGTYELRKNGALMTEQAGSGATRYTLDVNTGLITLGAALVPGDELRLKTEFDVPVRFDTDKLDITAETFEAGSVPSIPIIELKRL